jgi:hypothetical protein
MIEMEKKERGRMCGRGMGRENGGEKRELKSKR